MDLDKLDRHELIMLYGDVVHEMRNRNIIRTKNVVGDIGEYLATDFYSKTRGLPKLKLSDTSTENIDATSIKGERYSIKSTTSKTTGVFYGINPPGSVESQKQLFEYVVIVVLNENYQLQRIIELDWNSFLKHKKWHSRMKAWNLTVNRKLLADARILFDRNII